MYSFPENILTELKKELTELDEQAIDVNGKSLKASQCYHLETDPAHVLFNTNCPQDLRSKVEAILAKYSSHAGRS